MIDISFEKSEFDGSSFNSKELLENFTKVESLHGRIELEDTIFLLRQSAVMPGNVSFKIRSLSYSEGKVESIPIQAFQLHGAFTKCLGNHSTGSYKFAESNRYITFNNNEGRCLVSFLESGLLSHSSVVDTLHLKKNMNAYKRSVMLELLKLAPQISKYIEV